MPGGDWKRTSGFFNPSEKHGKYMLMAPAAKKFMYL
jgi:hypothetical protein